MAFDGQRSYETDEWDESFRRVTRCLQACRVAPRLLFTERAIDVIERTAKRAAEPSGSGPVTFAGTGLLTQTAEHFGRAIAFNQASAGPLGARGHLALARSWVSAMGAA